VKHAWAILLLTAAGNCWAAQEIVTVPTRTCVTDSDTREIS
jgi:hypothetical protein